MKTLFCPPPPPPSPSLHLFLSPRQRPLIGDHVSQLTDRHGGRTLSSICAWPFRRHAQTYFVVISKREAAQTYVRVVLELQTSTNCILQLELIDISLALLATAPAPKQAFLYQRIMTYSCRRDRIGSDRIAIAAAVNELFSPPSGPGSAPREAVYPVNRLARSRCRPFKVLFTGCCCMRAMSGLITLFSFVPDIAGNSDLKRKEIQR